MNKEATRTRTLGDMVSSSFPPPPAVGWSVVRFIIVGVAVKIASPFPSLTSTLQTCREVDLCCP